MVFYEPEVTRHNLPRDPFKVSPAQRVHPGISPVKSSHVWFLDL
jgi:hypothetical protein